MYGSRGTIQNSYFFYHSKLVVQIQMVAGQMDLACPLPICQDQTLQDSESTPPSYQSQSSYIQHWSIIQIKVIAHIDMSIDYV